MFSYSDSSCPCVCLLLGLNGELFILLLETLNGINLLTRVCFSEVLHMELFTSEPKEVRD